MRRYLLYFLLALTLSGCVDNNIVPEDPANGKGGMVIEFGGQSFKDVQITTKGTLPGSVENRVMNLYVMIFATDGSCVYSHFYDRNSRVDNAILPAGERYCWYVDEKDPASGELTRGRLRINSADLPTNVQGKVYLITNLDTELSTLSAARLDLVRTESELNSVVSLYKESTSSRLGNFVMVGYGNINIQGGNITALSCGMCTPTHSDNLIHLERIDSKIEFKIGIIPGAKTLVTADFGGGAGQYYQVIESFELFSWQVFNLPNGSYLVPQASDAPDSDKGGYFDSNLHSTESIATVNIMGYNPTDFTNINAAPTVPSTRKEYGFSFYMYENRQNAKKSVNNNAQYPGIAKYHLRDKRLRNSDGTFAAEDGDMWEYAPENGTYLELKGEVKMRHYLPDGSLDNYHIVYSDVVYYVHLGDFGSSTGTNASSLDDYSVERNTHYTYTINIRGVNSIAVESEKDKLEGYDKLHELQSGAKGDLYAAPLTNNYTFDAHYGQRVFEFKYSDFNIFNDPQQLSWFVSTPFGRKGMPDRVGEDMVEVPNGLDYRWVHFHVNTGANPNINYPWPGRESPEIIDVLEFSNYIRDQLTKKRAGQASDFDLHGNETIYVTVYVDEFYYESDPITAEVRPALWKEFVNKPSRIMNIICTSSVSATGNSSYYKSIVSIRQESIKSIYGNAATEGWGVEAFDELFGQLKFYNRTDNLDTEYNDRSIADIGNTTEMNGLYNSGKLWKLVNTSNNYVNGVQWSSFINLAVPNNNSIGPHTNFLVNTNERNTMRYSCLARNRDENGDGIIQKEEVKWYLASMGQLRQLFIGDQGLMGQARLYYAEDPVNETAPALNGDNYYKWRSRVISSTLNGDNKIMQLWAEEGCSTSEVGNDYSKYARQSIRCVRNLDRDAEVTKEITNPNSYPESPISVTKDPVTKYYTFDFTKMNPESLRPKTNNELIPMDENSLMARPYLKFETGPFANAGTLLSNEGGTDYGYLDNVHKKLLKGDSVCPEGYRVPNIREMAAIYNFIDFGTPANNYNDFWDGSNGMMVCNYYSYGNTDIGGKGFDATTRTWYFVKSGNLITLNYGGGASIRCVRDVD